MKTIACHDYNIYFNNWSALQQLMQQKYQKVFVLCDENTERHCLPILQRHTEVEFMIIRIASGEKNKTLSTCQEIWRSLLKNGANRHSLCINLGGGVIGDMGGFAASTFMRGMDFIQIPTTLLSQVDASVGGKLGIDFQGYKNMIGLIKNPTAVFVFDSFLNSLPAAELTSGFAEMLKHGLIRDKAHFESLAQLSQVNVPGILPLVHRSVSIKKEVTDEDPQEKGLRKILNFGHTIGHAIESFNLDTKNHLLHGEAIAIGMLIEAHLSYQKQNISLAELQEIAETIIRFFGHHPNCIPSLDQLLPYMLKDKKNIGDQISFTLLNGIGNAIWDQQCSQESIQEAVLFYSKR